MFNALIALFAVFSLSSNAYYEDLPEVISLANSGDFTLIENSAKCPGQYSPRQETDELRGREGSLCVQSLKLPAEVEQEIDLMNQAELENESDYDQRITSVFAFKYHRLVGAHANLSDVEDLASALNIPLSQMKDLTFSAEIANERTFSRFDDLFLGIEFKSNSKVSNFLLRSFAGQKVQVITFGDGLELYAGGGFYVTHYLFISNDKAFYVKLSWWNS